MNRFVLLAVLLGLLAPPLAKAADAFYINNGVASYFFPPTAAPDIDAINFLGAEAADFATAGTRQKLKLHDVRRLGWEGAGIEPFPERFDFLHRQHAV